MGKRYIRRRMVRLENRIKDYELRNQFAKQTAGGDKVVPGMHKPGSQNRKK